MNDLKYKCPKCGNTDKFKSTISVIAIVDHNGEVIEELDRYIFRSFMMTCQKCGYSTASKAFSDCAEQTEALIQRSKEKIIEFNEQHKPKVIHETKTRRKKIKVEC